jgi:pimeloyl-ACP methyl ester carboxylesterase
LRQSGIRHVIVAGHSLGGVLAFDAAAIWTDLTQPPDPFIRAVVTIDSPLSGLTALERFGAASYWGDCPALQDLRDRSYRSTVWQPWLVSSVNTLTSRGVRVVLVANPSDGAVLQSEQWISGALVNYALDYVDSGLNHSAIVRSPAALATIATWIQVVTGR